MKRRLRDRYPAELYVTDCICFKKKIDDIVTQAKELKLQSLKEVCKTLRCGTKCGLCRPHIKKRLYDTGQPPLPAVTGDGARSIPY